MIDRRGFLASLPLGALGARRRIDGALRGGGARPWRDGSPWSVRGSHRRERWGVQLYTLRGLMVEDPDGTLAAVAAIGYVEVELAGLYGMTPGAMRARLDAVGLRAASSHHGVDEVREGWDRTLDGAVELGQALIVVPSIPGDEQTSEGLRRVADDFNRAGEAARSAGLRFGYHNHDWEFGALPDGTVPMELLMARTDRDLVDWQMDVFWAVNGGADPVALIESTGRVTSLHVKDRTAAGEMVAVGDGVIDFDALVDRAEALGLLHAFVEHDAPDDPLDSIRRSYDHLTRDGFDERIA